MNQKKLPCLLCNSQSFLWQSYIEKIEKSLTQRNYFLCDSCGYVFLDPCEHLKPFEEEKRYKKHNNIATKGYVQFLNRLLKPVLERVSSKDSPKGLDFGCGPTQVMEELCQKEGFSIKSYDPFFYAQEEVLKDSYNFILCCEVVEHFYNPILEFEKLFNLLKPKGVLGIQTSILKKIEGFPSWSYRHDLTHVGFYQQKTFQWLKKRFGWNLSYTDSDKVILFEKILN